MKRIFNVLSLAASLLYLLAVGGILVFQNTLASLFLSIPDTLGASGTVFPVNTMIRLLFAGVPCAVLAAVHLAGSHRDSRILPAATAVYCSTALILQDLIASVATVFNNMIAARLNGAYYLAKLSAVNNLTGYAGFLIDAGLVFLLISSLFCIKDGKTS